MCSQSRHPLLILTSLNVPHTRVFSSAAKTLSGGRVRSPRCFSLFRLNSCESNVPGFAPKARARTCPASRASRLPAHAGVSHLVRNSRERRFRVWAFSLTFLDFARRASRTLSKYTNTRTETCRRLASYVPSRARVVFDTALARAVRDHDNWRALSEAAVRDDGDVDESFRVAFKRYFVTDYVFVEDFIDLLARALASAPTFAIKARLGAFLNQLLEGEATLFRESLRALWNIDADDAASVRAIGDDDVATAMSTFLRRVAEDGDWLSRVAVVAVAEGLYLSWGLRVVDDDVRKVASGLVDRASAERALYAKWVWPLHSSEEFQRAVCAFVEAFNDAWRDADDDSKTRCEAVVREMLDLERAFTELLSSS